MAFQEFPRILQTGILAWLLVLIFNSDSANSTIIVSQNVTKNDTNRQENKFFLNKTSGKIFVEKYLTAAAPLEKKIKRELCEEANSLFVKRMDLNGKNITCVFPIGSCQEKSFMNKLKNNKNDISEKLLTNLECFNDNFQNGTKGPEPLKNLSKTDEQKLKQMILKTFNMRKSEYNENSSELSDMSALNKVHFQKLLKISPKKLCSWLPQFQNLNLTQVKKIIIYSQCQEEIRKISASMPEELGEMVSLLRKKDIMDLENIQLKAFAGVVCQHEDAMDTKMVKLLTKRILQSGILRTKANKQDLYLKKISCLLKHVSPRDMEGLRFSDEVKKTYCKNIGADQIKFRYEEDIRKVTKYCMKEVLHNNLQLSELGNLLNFFQLNNIHHVTSNQLLEWASILQFYIHNDEEVKYIGNKLYSIFKNKLPKMTPKDLQKVGLFVETWNDKEKEKIPKRTWSVSTDPILKTCQKMDKENNKNFKLCFKIIPFLLKSETELKQEEKDELSRSKRDTGVQSKPLTCEEIKNFSSNIENITIEKIKSISKEEFLKCLKYLGEITNFPDKHLEAFMTIINETFVDVDSWSVENITALASLIAKLPFEELMKLNISSENIVKVLGNLKSLSPKDLTALFEKWLNVTKSGDASKISIYNIKLIGNLICGISKIDLDKISPQIAMNAVKDISKLTSCSINQQRGLLEKVISSLNQTDWSGDLLTSLGPLIRFLNTTTIQNIDMEQLNKISAATLSKIPSIQSAIILEKILPELVKTLHESTKVSEVQMVVTILCDLDVIAKSALSAKSLKVAVQNLATNTPNCTLEERNILMNKLVNTSSESLTNILKQMASNISNLLEKPSTNLLGKLVKDQVSTIIDIVFQNIPTVHLDAFFNKWFKDYKPRNSPKVASLEKQMLGFLACGLNISLDKIDKIDENTLWRALDSIDNGYYCPAAKQNLWMKSALNFSQNLIQNLTKMADLKLKFNITAGKLPTVSSLVNMLKDFMKKENFFKENAMFTNAILRFLNVTSSESLVSLYNSSIAFCRLNITDITQLNETLLINFLASKQKGCTEKEQKIWLRNIIKSTMHKIVDMNSTELDSFLKDFMKTLETNKFVNELLVAMEKISKVEMFQLIKMASQFTKNASASPELKFLGEISTCLGGMAKIQQSNHSKTELLKYMIDKCIINSLKNSEKIIDSVSMMISKVVMDGFSSTIFALHKSDMEKIFQAVSQISANARTTFESWINQLQTSNSALNFSAKYTLLRFLSCNLEFDANNLKLNPETIMKSIVKFAQGESCTSDKMTNWLKKHSNIASKVVTSIGSSLKDLINGIGNKDDKPQSDGPVVGDGSGKDKNDDSGKKKETNSVFSGTQSRSERLLVKADFPFPKLSSEIAANEKMVESLWKFTRLPASQKEMMLLRMATKKSIDYLLENKQLLKKYMDKDKDRLLKLVDQVNKRSKLLKTADIKVDEKFLSSISTVESGQEAQSILKKAMVDLKSKSKKDIIKSLPKQLIKKSGMLLINNMYDENTRDDLIKEFEPTTTAAEEKKAGNEMREKKVSLVEYGLLQKVMKGNPSPDTMSLVLKSSLMSAVPADTFSKLPNDLLCKMDIAVDELQADQVLSILKKCSSNIKTILKTDATKLGLISAKIPNEMIEELNKKQLIVLIKQVCQYEYDLDIDKENTMFLSFKKLGGNVVKESNEFGCTLKYGTNEIKEISVKSQLENAKAVCKILGVSMNEKMTAESGKIYKDLCFKLTKEKELSFKELGSLIYFLEASDVEMLDDDTILEAAQILSRKVQSKSVFEAISKRLKKISSLKTASALTADNITVVSTFIGAWDDISKIPKTNLEQSTMLLTDVISAQMKMKKNCIKRTGDKTTCSELDPYMKKIIEVLLADPAKARRKRRSASTADCKCDFAVQLGDAAEMLSSKDLEKILCKDNFETCMEKLSLVTTWPSTAQSVFANKAVTFLGSPTLGNWSTTLIKSVVAAIPGLPIKEINNLELSDVEIAFELGKQVNWEKNKLNAAFETIYKKLLNSNSSEITSFNLQLFRNLLCGISSNITGSIESKEYAKATREIGVIECFTTEQHKTWIAKAIKEFGKVEDWSATVISSIGAVISGLSAKEIQKLSTNQIQSIKLDTIPKISNDALKNFQPQQFSAMTTSQVMKITKAQKENLSDEQLKYITKKERTVSSAEEEKKDKDRNNAPEDTFNYCLLTLSVLMVILL